ncbi:hypothetical protein [Chitinophaga sp. HK235]|uniref:hypothetical protein n=1 Tax=Chitinophaga sp. HK235 TaxID=2952571 RepID=UPI001BACB373|nr:hypothetical protein [Chitinophaga sp. HK235]
MNNPSNGGTNRRDFLGKMIAGATMLSIPSISFGIGTAVDQESKHMSTNSAENWLSKIKGKHRMVLDVPQPHGIYPFAWPRVFLISNHAAGTPEKDCCAVVVLRHEAIPYALKNELWEKYKLGEMFKIDDPKTKAAATRNPFWEPKPGDYTVPGIGNVAIGINDLQSSGVLFGACNMAITVYSAVAAQKMSLDPQAVKKEWTDGMLPGVQLLPSGLWAITRAQEKNCGYCFAG